MKRKPKKNQVQINTNSPLSSSYDISSFTVEWVRKNVYIIVGFVGVTTIKSSLPQAVS
jgi:hypothetical protein